MDASAEGLMKRPGGRGLVPMELTSATCWSHYAFDVGVSIDLDAAERTLRASAGAERETLSTTRGTASSFQFRPSPVRTTRAAESIPISAPGAGSESWCTVPSVQFTLYDFGAISIAYGITLDGARLDGLATFADAVFECEALLADARHRVHAFVSELGSAVVRPCVTDLVEDYRVFHVARWSSDGAEPGEGSQCQALDVHTIGSEIAASLRAATEPLSADEVADALGCAIAYGLRDLTVIDWNATITFESDPSSAADVLAVLEFANVQLLEMRFLDDRLDAVLDRAYRSIARGDARHAFRVTPGASVRAERRRLAILQMDSALLFEGVNNALKLLGDNFLCRLYRLAARRLHLDDWDKTIRRKLDILQRLYEKTADEQAARRLEALEWIVIILILISLILPFFSSAWH